jgi:hypothetical protein
MTDPFSEATSLFPQLGRYRKLVVSLLSTAAPLVIFLVSAPHSAGAIVAASVAYVLANFGVYRVPNG